MERQLFWHAFIDPKGLYLGLPKESLFWHVLSNTSMISPSLELFADFLLSVARLAGFSKRSFRAKYSKRRKIWLSFIVFIHGSVFIVCNVRFYVCIQLYIILASVRRFYHTPTYISHRLWAAVVLELSRETDSEWKGSLPNWHDQ